MGKNLLGFSEKEIGRMQFWKYSELFEKYQYFYNMQQTNRIYKLEAENDGDSEVILF